MADVTRPPSVWLTTGLPVAVALVCVAVFGLWIAPRTGPPPKINPRAPVDHHRGAAAEAAPANPGTLIAGAGRASALPGEWPGFRGPRRDNIAVNSQPIAREWPAAGLPVAWTVELGEGHAGAAVSAGRVYLVDYDREREEDAIRCLSLDDGAEIWRYTYSVKIKRNHGMSRTAPAVAGGVVVALGPMCHLTALDAASGTPRWRRDLVAENAAVVPPWYAGQCPLIDGERVIIAPGGKPLMMALDLTSGTVIWETQGDEDAGMTHSSIATIEFEGRRQYVYCARTGVYGVDAESGEVLWRKGDWKIGIANIPTPVPVGGDRIFFSGGYKAGCVMIRLVRREGRIETEEVFRLKDRDFGADQQTPILFQDHLYGVIPGGQLACLSLDGRRLWDSGERRFGLGPFLISDGLILTLDDQECALHLSPAEPGGYRELAMAKILEGHDAWAPMAMAEGRLILRDLTRMVCLDLSARP